MLNSGRGEGATPSSCDKFEHRENVWHMLHPPRGVAIAMIARVSTHVSHEGVAQPFAKDIIHRRL